MTTKTWMVRAGRGSEFIEDFRERNVVALGWNEVSDLSGKSREDILAEVSSNYPSYKQQKAVITASQLYRFASEIAEGDNVVSYDSSARKYLFGKVVGSYEYRSGILDSFDHYRTVEWSADIDRDDLSVPTKNVLGAISTLFLISEKPAFELLQLSKGEKPSSDQALSESEEESEEYLLKDIQARSREFIKDKLDRLDWDQMQEVVAGMLRAMGYKTKVSPAGPDRGKDIVASPDGFGFEPPRIVVEVKHRNNAMGAPDLKSFLHGKHSEDKLLYVSTGGFTKDALYEAERASNPCVLMNMDGLVDGLLEHYEMLDPDIRALIPLTKVYWPTN